MKKIFLFLIIVGMANGAHYHITTNSASTLVSTIEGITSDGDTVFIDSFGTSHRCSLDVGSTGQIDINYLTTIIFTADENRSADTLEKKSGSGYDIFEIGHNSVRIIGNPLNPPHIRWTNEAGSGTQYLIYSPNTIHAAYFYGLKIYRGSLTASGGRGVYLAAVNSTDWTIFRKCIFSDTVHIGYLNTRATAPNMVWLDSCIFNNTRHYIGSNSKVTWCLERVRGGELAFYGDSSNIAYSFINCALSSSEIPTWDDNASGCQKARITHTVIDSGKHNTTIDGLRNSVIDTSVMIYYNGGSSAALYVHNTQADDSVYNLQFKNCYILGSTDGKIINNTAICDSMEAWGNIYSGIGTFSVTATTTRYHVDWSMFSNLSNTLTYITVGADTVIYTNPLLAIKDTFKMPFPIQKSTNRIISSIPNKVMMGPYGFLINHIDTFDVTSTEYKTIDSLNFFYRWNEGNYDFNNSWFIGSQATIYYEDSVAGGAWTRFDTCTKRGGQRDTAIRTGASQLTEYFYRSIAIRSDGLADTSFIDSLITPASGGPSQFLLAIDDDGNGATTPSDTTVDSASVINIVAIPDTGYNGAGFRWTRSNTLVTIADTTDMTTTVTVGGAATITADFVIEPLIVKVRRSPTVGGTIHVRTLP